MSQKDNTNSTPRKCGFSYPPIHDRIALKIRKNLVTGCWEWTGKMPNRYAKVKNGTKGIAVHRFVFEWLRGPVPDGLELDHVCRNRKCANPYHLEPVTHKENVRRGNAGKQFLERTHCPSGHPYDETNTYLDPSGSRKCRICVRKRGLDYERRNKAARNARCREYYYRTKGK